MNCKTSCETLVNWTLTRGFTYRDLPKMMWFAISSQKYATLNFQKRTKFKICWPILSCLELSPASCFSSTSFINPFSCQKICNYDFTKKTLSSNFTDQSSLPWSWVQLTVLRVQVSSRTTFHFALSVPADIKEGSPPVKNLSFTKSMVITRYAAKLINKLTNDCSKPN